LLCLLQAVVLPYFILTPLWPRGGTIANYAEYSGDPSDWAVEALTETICQLPNIKHIIVGGAIANFTDVKATFGGIINGFRASKANGYLGWSEDLGKAWRTEREPGSCSHQKARRRRV